MRNGDQGLVEIVRDFVEAYRFTRRVLDLFRKGELTFEYLQELIGDDAGSVLFRLKERCHAQFREVSTGTELEMHRDALFDLAVGSLFHEAMKFRENFYQREVYGPRVRALRSRSGDEAKPLFEEFEKILAVVSRRLDEGLNEAEILLDQTVQQLRMLIARHRRNGFVSRYLIENTRLVEEIFDVDFDDLLVEIYGSASEGYRVAGESYLVSGYYEAAIDALSTARERGGDPEELEPPFAFARGMAAYLSRDYAKSVSYLASWAAVSKGDPSELRRLAHDVVTSVGELAHGAEDESVGPAVAALLETLTGDSVGPAIS
jgi:hypothetical protein